jgi:serine/threonine protein kinase
MGDFVDPDWAVALLKNGLSTFDELWEATSDWIECPNVERGGLSGVSRLELALPDGRRMGAYLKRQSGHVRRTLRHPWRGEATFAREFRMLAHLREHHVQAPLPLYFGQRVVDGTPRAILLTQELEGFSSLDVFSIGESKRCSSENRALIRDVAQAVRRLHDCGVQHRSLYEKHLFIRKRDQGFDVALIDLEKSRMFRIPFWAPLQDLVTLNYRSPRWRLSERIFFLKSYHGCRRLDFWQRWQCRWIQRLSSRKMTRRPHRDTQ